ncbi:hypothetical protein GCM10027341_19160 [Spirosoma knui]
MKTYIKSLFVALTIGAVTSANAFSDPNPITRPTAAASYKTGIYTSNTGKLNIALDKQKGGTVDISLKNAEGKVLYNKHLGKNESTCRTRLNLDELEDGVYYVEISNGVETTRQSVTIATKKPSTPERTIAMTTPSNQ